MTTAELRPDITHDGASDAGRDAALLAAAAASVNRLNRLGTIESIGRAIVEETRSVIDYHNCRVYLLQPPERLVPIAFRGSVGTYDDIPLALLETTVGVGFTGWAAATGQPLLVPDANADPRGATIPGTDDVDESMICVPMRLDNATIGVVTLSKLGLHQFREADVQLMTILADAAATAIGTARALDEAGRQQARLRSLLEMSSELSQTLDPLAVADRIAEHMARATGVEECAISYWDRPSGRVLSWGYYPPSDRVGPGPEYDLSHFPLSEHVLRDRVAVTIHVADPSADAAEVRLLRESDQSALTMIPLVAKGEAIGLVELISLVPRQLDAEQVELAWAMANEAAMALSNARLYEAARAQADRDPLTDFYNHRYLQERLAQELLRSARTGARLALMMLDLDDFKPVNDTLGHQVGDDVLRWTAEQIRTTLRATDVPARYGGDEFAVILPETDVDTACAAAERILTVFRDSPFRSRGGSAVPISVSIGIAGRPPDGPLAAELIGAADRALYRAKRAGGGRVATTADGNDSDTSIAAPFPSMENVAT